MKRPLIALAAAVLAWSCAGPAPEPQSAPETGAFRLTPAKFDPDADPNADLAAAITRARASNRRIILDVGGEWCSWCHTLDNFIDAHTDLGTAIARDFVWVKINFSDENENRSFLSKYPRITGYPHLYVLSKDGDLLHSQNTAELELGKSYDLAKMEKFFATWAKK